jgi:hypothetical protein
MDERGSYGDAPERGRLLRWLDPGPEPAPVPDVRTAQALAPTEAAVAAVDELLPLRIACRW